MIRTKRERVHARRGSRCPLPSTTARLFAVALLALAFPEILGTGHDTVERLLNGHYPLQEHLIGAGKLIGTFHQ